MEKEIICIVCPKGCKINVRTGAQSAGGSPETTQSQAGSAGLGAKVAETVYEVTGHSCTRGYEYALSECTNPVRTLTTTVRLLNDDTDGAGDPGTAGSSGNSGNSDNAGSPGSSDNAGSSGNSDNADSSGNSDNADSSGNSDGARKTDGTRRTGGIQPVLVPVKSSAPLPKDLLKECVKAVNSVAARPPIRIGDVIVRDILGTGTDIIATANITGEECKWRSGSSSRSTRGRQAQGQSSSTASAEK